MLLELLALLLLSAVPGPHPAQKASELYENGVSLLDAGEKKEALLVLEKALALDPHLTGARLALAETQEEQGMNVAAERTLWEGLRWHPENLELRKRLYHKLTAAERHMEASDTIWLGVELSEGRDIDVIRLAQASSEGLPETPKRPAQRPLISLPPEDLPEEVPTGTLSRPLGPVGMSYSLFVPDKYNKKKRWALVIGLHDKSVRSEAFLELLKVALGPNPEVLIACPQAPTSQSLTEEGVIQALSDWNRQETDPLVYALMLDLLRRYRVDLERVLLLGVGSGGTHCYGLALAHPEFFQGVAVVYASLPEWAKPQLAGAPSLPFLLMAPGEEADLFASMSQTKTALIDAGAKLEWASTDLPPAGFPVHHGQLILKWWQKLKKKK